jgi:hypothetical protein
LNITKYYCDKCEKEVLCKAEPTGLIDIRVEFTRNSSGMGIYPQRKEVCHDCFTELTGIPVNAKGRLGVLEKEADKTVGERLEEIIREVCREEMGE